MLYHSYSPTLYIFPHVKPYKKCFSIPQLPPKFFETIITTFFIKYLKYIIKNMRKRTEKWTNHLLVFVNELKKHHIYIYMTQISGPYEKNQLRFTLKKYSHLTKIHKKGTKIFKIHKIKHNLYLSLKLFYVILTILTVIF